MKAFSIFLGILLILDQCNKLAHGQFTAALQSIQLVQPNDCDPKTQYYDTSRLQCLSCPANSRSFDCKLILIKSLKIHFDLAKIIYL